MLNDVLKPDLVSEDTAHMVYISTDKCIFRCRQSNVRRLLSPSDCCRAHGNQIVAHISDNKTALGSSRKLGGPAEHLIDGSEKRICRSAFEF